MSWSSYSLNSQGDVKYEQAVDCDGNLELVPLTVGEDPEYSQFRWKNVNNKKVHTNLVPYWSPDLAQYIFGPDYGGRGLCVAAGSMGAVQTDTEPQTLLLCPKAFSFTGAAQVLGSRSAAKNELSQLLPRSTTFLHEMFHLVHGYDATPDATCIVSDRN